MYRKTFRFLIAFVVGISTLSAQEIVLLSKETLLSKVAQNNTSIKINIQSYREALADYKASNAVFLPHITASHTGMVTTNPLMAFGVKLNQEIVTPADFNPAALNNPKQIQNFATRIAIQQPLLHLDGLYFRKAAQHTANAHELQLKRTTSHFILAAENTYMELQLAYIMVEVLKKTLTAVKATQKTAQDHYEQGYLQRADLLTIAIRVTEVKNQLQQAQHNIQNISDRLSLLSNTTQKVQYQPTEKLQLVRQSEYATLQLSEDRSDLKAMQQKTAAYRSNYKAHRMSFLPQLNAFGSYELHDQNLFKGSANGYTLGLQLTWDIFKGAKRLGKVQKSKASYEKASLAYEAYKAESQLEFNKTKRLLATTATQLELTRLAVDQAKESLRIRKDRYKEGLEKTADLLVAEAQFTQKQLTYYQTIFQYNITKRYLHFLTKE